MSIESAIQRVALINSALADPALMLQGAGVSADTGGTAAPGGSTAQTGSFSDALEQASLSASAGSSSPPASTASAETSSLIAALEQNGLTAADGESQAGAEALAPSLGSAYGSYGTTGLSSGYALPSTGGASGLSSATSGYGLPSTGSASQLAGAGGAYAAGDPSASGDALGQRIVAIAEGQAGRAEEPLGSNEGASIAMYRSATAGAMPGAPWCAYFASWVARQAGEPIGSSGQGLGSVAEIWSWAQSTGRAIANGPGVVPKPGDLIVFGDEHVGIVRGVLPNGEIETVEGNYENKVALNVRSPSEPTGYVEMS
jgi:CHAP domain